MRTRLTTYFFVLASVCAASAWAQEESPPFDRPGIAFSTQTLSPGAITWEQGLPDAVRDKQDGVESTLYMTDPRLRLGLMQGVEIQVAEAPYNRLRTKAAHVTTVEHGFGDLTLAVKVAPPSPVQNLSWAFLGSVLFDTGNKAFRADSREYSLAGTAGLDVGNDRSVAFYASVTRAGSDSSYTVSPNYNWSISQSIGAYIEAGYTFGDSDNDKVAGGGLTWMIANTLQLDVYALQGLTAGSTDLQGGVGVSMYFH